MIESYRVDIYTLIMSHQDINSTISRGSTLKSEGNIIELQDDIKRLTKNIRLSFKKGLQDICKELKNID